MPIDAKKWGYFVLFFIIGAPAWLLVTGLFLQIPIFINTTPEKYDIAAFLVVGIQIGNLFGFVCAAIQSFCSISQKLLVLVVLLFGLAVDLFIAFGSHLTIALWDQPRSLGLFIAFFCSGGVGSLSVVSMFPFVSKYGTFLTSALSTGSGTSGLILTLLSLIQQPGTKDQLFDLPLYFFILTIFFVCAIIALIIVWRIESNILEREGLIRVSPEVFDPANILPDEPSESPSIPSDTSLWSVGAEPLFNQFYISLMNYILLGLAPYIVAKFHWNGNDVSTALVFWISLGGVFAGCIGRILTLKFFTPNLHMFTCVQVVLFIYLIFLSFIPHAGLHVAWAWLSVIFYSLYSGLYGYADTTNYNKVYTLFPPESREKGSRAVGVTNQIGACMGSLIGFFLVMYWFES